MHVQSEIVKLKDIKAGDLVTHLPALGQWTETIQRGGADLGIEPFEQNMYGQAVTVMMCDGATLPERILEAEVLRVTFHA